MGRYKKKISKTRRKERKKEKGRKKDHWGIIESGSVGEDERTKNSKPCKPIALWWAVVKGTDFCADAEANRGLDTNG